MIVNKTKLIVELSTKELKEANGGSWFTEEWRHKLRDYLYEMYGKK